MGNKELEHIKDAFATNWIAPTGPNVDLFEYKIADYLDADHVTALVSGTSAIHLALATLGVRKGDIVICQDLTFAGSAFPIQYQGAEPVFIDSEKDTWNMDPVLLRQALTDLRKTGKRVAAIIVVHLFGMPAKMNEIMEIAGTFGVPVIEDAAEALGSMYFGVKCGNLGEVGVLSFNGNKIITTSAGGAFITRHKKLIDHARYLSTQSKGQTPYYHHTETGFNYKMSNVLAGIGIGQMDVLDLRVEARRRIHDMYLNHLGNIPGISFLKEPIGHFSNRWLTTILIDEKLTGGISNELIRLKLEEQNIESRPVWKPMHLQPVFNHCLTYDNGVATSLFHQGLCLPSGSAMAEVDVKRVCQTIVKSIHNSLPNSMETNKLHTITE